MTTKTESGAGIESPYAWTRLFVSLLLMTIGGAGTYTVSVVLPRIQADFGIARGDASLPYSAVMIGFALGGIFMGRLADRVGVMVPVKQTYPESLSHAEAAVAAYERHPNDSLRWEAALIALQTMRGFVVAVKPGDDRASKPATLAYEMKKSAPYVPTGIARGELAWLWSDSGILTCMHTPTGEIRSSTCRQMDRLSRISATRTRYRA